MVLRNHLISICALILLIHYGSGIGEEGNHAMEQKNFEGKNEVAPEKFKKSETAVSNPSNEINLKGHLDELKENVEISEDLKGEKLLQDGEKEEIEENGAKRQGTRFDDGNKEIIKGNEESILRNSEAFNQVEFARNFVQRRRSSGDDFSKYDNVQFKKHFYEGKEGDIDGQLYWDNVDGYPVVGRGTATWRHDAEGEKDKAINLPSINLFKKPNLTEKYGINVEIAGNS